MSTRNFTAAARDIIMKSTRIAAEADFHADAADMAGVSRGLEGDVPVPVEFEGHVPAVDWPHIKAAIERLHP